MIAKIGVRLALLVAIGATIAWDRVTKHVAATTLAGTPGRSFLAEMVRLEYVENTGGFLNLGRGKDPQASTEASEVPANTNWIRRCPGVGKRRGSVRLR
jgi:hypothetical protein